MELWIRSQDKEKLLKINDIWIDDTDMVDEKYVTIMANLNSCDYDLGTYKTKERALEVLNEIQNLIKPKIIYHQQDPVKTIENGIYKLSQKVDAEIKELNTIVYEMPEN